MGYLKGQFDRGELAGMMVIIVETTDPEAAKELVSRSDGANYSIHEVYASSFDIDYNQHKLIFSPALKVGNG